MSTDVSPEIGTRGLEFFRQNATVNSHGVSTITQKNYFDFHKSEGIDRETIERFNAAENELLNGAYLYVNELMRKKADDAANEDEAAKCSAKLRITKPVETINMGATSRVVCRIPRKPEDLAAGKPATTIKHGVTTIRIDRDRSIALSVTTQCSESAAARYK